MNGEARRFGSITPRLIMAMLIVSMAGVLAALYLFPISNNSLAAEPAMVDDTPLQETTNVFGIRSAAVANVTSSISDALELQATPRGNSIDFVASNRGSDPILVDVDEWRIDSNIYGNRDSKMIDEPINTVVKSGDRLVLQTLDLSEYRDLLEYYPGTHAFELAGLKWTDELVGPYLNETRGTNAEVIHVKAMVNVDYDQGILKSSANKLLRADNLRMSVAGTGPAFEVSDKNPKDISFYYVNEGNSNLSFRPTRTLTTVWMADDRFPDDMSLVSINSDDRSCVNLKPGDSIEMGRLNLSTDRSPIGANGIAQRHHSDTAIPGVYIVNHVVGVIPCEPSSESALTSPISVYAAFEVKQ